MVIPQDVQGIAYVLLYAQQQQQHPGLTPAEFKTWLKAQVHALAAAAKKDRS